MTTAFVIGHQSYAKGARSDTLAAKGFGLQEYDFWSIMAPKIVDELKLRGHDIVLERYRGRGNVTRWAQRYDLLIEAHFNAANVTASGTLCLYGSNRPHMRPAAAAFNKAWASLTGASKRAWADKDGAYGVGPGVAKYRGRYDENRIGGGYLVRAMDALILEPFFGTNPSDVERALQGGGLGFVKGIATACEAAMLTRGKMRVAPARSEMKEAEIPEKGKMRTAEGHDLRVDPNTSRTVKQADLGRVSAVVGTGAGAFGTIGATLKAVPPWVGIILAAALVAGGAYAIYYFTQIKKNRKQDIEDNVEIFGGPDQVEDYEESWEGP